MILSYSVNETNQYFSLSEFTRIYIHLFNNIQPVHTKVIVTCTLRDESMYIYDKSHNLLSRGTTRVSKGYAVYHRRDRVINHVTDLLNHLNGVSFLPSSFVFSACIRASLHLLRQFRGMFKMKTLC